jgi:hypothetical protein
MPDPVLRFAAGSPERPSSTTWRLWVHGSDTYLAARIVKGTYKLSMHKTGEWISAFTSESGGVFKHTGSRRQRTWKRPPEFKPGWTEGAIVAIPWVKWRGQFRPREKAPPDTIWVPGPARKKKRLFIVLFAGPTVPSDGIKSVARPDDHVVGKLPLSNGETVWLLARQAFILPDERKFISDADREFLGFQVSDGDLSTIDLWGFVTTSSAQGGPLIVQFQLGKHHVEIVGT